MLTSVRSGGGHMGVCYSLYFSEHLKCCIMKIFWIAKKKNKKAWSVRTKRNPLETTWRLAQKARRSAAGSCDKPGRRGELTVRKGRRAHPAASCLWCAIRVCACMCARVQEQLYLCNLRPTGSLEAQARWAGALSWEQAMGGGRGRRPSTWCAGSAWWSTTLPAYWNPPAFSHISGPDKKLVSSVQSLSHVWLCGPMDCSTPSLPSPIPRVYSNSCPLSRWCHSAISSSVVPFSFRLQSFSLSGSFQMSQMRRNW